MRAVLGVIGLLVVVFIVMQLARSQLKAVQPALPPAAPAGAAAPVATPQQQAADELNKALELGRQRAASAAD